MSQNGLRFTLDVDGLTEMATAVVSFTLYPGRFKDEQHSQDFARYLADGFRHDAETAACVSNSPKLWPGKRFTLTSHPSFTLNREWQVTDSVLKGEQPQAQHGHHGEGTTLSNCLDVIPADRTWRSSPCPNPPLTALRAPLLPARRARKSSAMSMVASGGVFTGTVTVRETKTAPAGYGGHRRGPEPDLATSPSRAWARK